jgi:hypothetical protein
MAAVGAPGDGLRMPDDPTAAPTPPHARRAFWPTVLPPVAAFVATGLLAPVYSDEPFDAGLTAWQAVVLWPIGLVLVGVPTLVLLGIRSTRLLRLGQIVVGAAGVVSMAAVAGSEDAQAGLAFMWAPILGSASAAAILAIDGYRHGRR